MLRARSFKLHLRHHVTWNWITTETFDGTAKPNLITFKVSDIRRPNK